MLASNTTGSSTEHGGGDGGESGGGKGGGDGDLLLHLHDLYVGWRRLHTQPCWFVVAQVYCGPVYAGVPMELNVSRPPHLANCWTQPRAGACGSYMAPWLTVCVWNLVAWVIGSAKFSGLSARMCLAVSAAAWQSASLRVSYPASSQVAKPRLGSRTTESTNLAVCSVTWHWPGASAEMRSLRRKHSSSGSSLGAGAGRASSCRRRDGQPQMM